MSKQIEFFFDFGSPYSYLTAMALPDIAARTGAQIVHRPVLLGAVFQQLGNASPVDIPSKGEWMWADLKRWAARREVPLIRHDPFPVNTLMMMRGAIVAERDGVLADYAEAIWQAFWADGVRLDNPDAFVPVLRGAGLDPRRYAEGVQDPAVKEALKRQSADAVARGVFGVPTCIVADTLYWGNDRLDFVEAAAAS